MLTWFIVSFFQFIIFAVTPVDDAFCAIASVDANLRNVDPSIATPWCLNRSTMSYGVSYPCNVFGGAPQRLNYVSVDCYSPPNPYRIVFSPDTYVPTEIGALGQINLVQLYIQSGACNDTLRSCFPSEIGQLSNIQMFFYNGTC
jgi:hypothetical protein